MGAVAGLVQLEARPPDDHLLAVGDIVLQDAFQRQHARLGAVHQGQEVDPEGDLHLGELEELVEDDFRLGFALQGDDDAHSGAVGLVAQVGDLVQALLLDQLGDAFQQAGLVDLVGQLGDDDAVAAAGGFLDVGLGADDKVALAAAVGGADAFLAEDQATGGKVGAGHDAHELVDIGRGVVDEQGEGGAQLAEVVGRDVGGHADGDAGGAVEEQVGQAGRQDLGLLQSAVKVGDKVDGLLVDVAQHLLGDGRQAGLGIALGGRGIAVHRVMDEHTAGEHKVVVRLDGDVVDVKTFGEHSLGDDPIAQPFARRGRREVAGHKAVIRREVLRLLVGAVAEHKAMVRRAADAPAVD